MAAGEKSQQAVDVLPPTSVNTKTVNTTSHTAVALSATGKYIRMFASGDDIKVLFGTSAVGAADANDWPIADGTYQDFRIPSRSTTTHFRSYAASTCTLYWYVSSP